MFKNFASDFTAVVIFATVATAAIALRYALFV